MEYNDDDFINYEYEMEKNLESAENILSYVILFIDSILLIFCYFFLKSNNKVVKSLKCKLYSLFIIDILFLLIRMYTFQKKDSIPNEFFFSLLYSCEYLLIICFLEQILTNYNSLNNIERKKIDPFQQALIFLFIILSYDKFFKSPPIIIYLIEYGFIFGLILFFYKYVQTRFFEIEQILKNNSDNSNLCRVVLGTPFYILIFSFLNYFLKIIKILKVNKELLFLIIILDYIMKISSKLLFFFILIIILYIIDKKETEYNVINQENKNKKNSCFNLY